MTFSHDTGVYNVEASLSAWLWSEIAGDPPPTVTQVTLNLNAPETPIVPPMWSVHYLGSNPDVTSYQGMHTGHGTTGGLRYGIMEVNCWVSRKFTNWRAQLAQMQDAVTAAVMGTPSVLIRDFYTDAQEPAPTGYRVVIDRVEGRMPPSDPNPDIERKRLLVYYHWTERV